MEATTMAVNPCSFTAYGISPVVSVPNGTEVPETYTSWQGGQRRYVQLLEETDEIGAFRNPGFPGGAKINVAEDVWAEGAQAVTDTVGGQLAPFGLTADAKRARFGFDFEEQMFCFVIWDAQKKLIHICEISGEVNSDCLNLYAKRTFMGNLDEVPKRFDAVASALVAAHASGESGTIYARSKR